MSLNPVQAHGPALSSICSMSQAEISDRLDSKEAFSIDLANATQEVAARAIVDLFLKFTFFYNCATKGIFKEYDSLKYSKNLMRTSEVALRMLKTLHQSHPTLLTSEEISDFESRYEEICSLCPNGETVLQERDLDIISNLGDVPRSAPYESRWGKYIMPAAAPFDYVGAFSRCSCFRHYIYASVRSQIDIFYGVELKRMCTVISFGKNPKQSLSEVLHGNFSSEESHRAYLEAKIDAELNEIAQIVQTNYQKWGIAGFVIGHLDRFKKVYKIPEGMKADHGHFVILFHRKEGQDPLSSSCTEQFMFDDPISPFQVGNLNRKGQTDNSLETVGGPVKREDTPSADIGEPFKPQENSAGKSYQDKITNVLSENNLKIITGVALASITTYVFFCSRLVRH